MCYKQLASMLARWAVACECHTWHMTELMNFPRIPTFTYSSPCMPMYTHAAEQWMRGQCSTNLKPHALQLIIARFGHQPTTRPAAPSRRCTGPLTSLRRRWVMLWHLST